MPQALTPSEVVACRVREVRERWKWTQQRLAAECKRSGSPWITRTLIAELESGRKVSVSLELLLGLANAFGVAPVHLLVPFEGRVEIGGRAIPVKRVRAWICGRQPLRAAHELIYRQEVPGKQPFPLEIRRLER
jgi:transcriptional regulator with XRE-family HTH domain